MLNYSASIKILVLSTSVIASMAGNQVKAQVISEISVDPYNNSNFQTEAIENIPRNEPVDDVVYINAPSTPSRNAEVEGNLTSSNQFLPAIPPISEPYSEQQNAETINPNQTLTSNPQPSTQGRSINVSPDNNVATQKTPLPPQPRDGRRSLKDILVQSNPTGSTNITTTSNNISLLSKSGQKIYKVLVNVKSAEDKNKIKAVYPEAFSKNINGDSFLQIGIFTNQDNVNQVSQALANLGFKAVVMQ